MISSLRTMALVVVTGGAVASLALMLRAGHRQKSLLLLGLFTIWTVSPFAGAVLAHIISKRWSIPARAALYIVMIVMTFGSVSIYTAVAFGYSSAKVGFIFLVIPFVSWLLVGIVTATGLIQTRLALRQ